MSLTSSLTNSVRSATYNPEAEKAIKEEREKAAKVIKEIKDYADSLDKNRLELASLPNIPSSGIKNLDQFTKEIRKWILDNPDVSDTVAKAKQEEFLKKGGELFTVNTALIGSSSTERVMTYLNTDFEQKKLLNAADRKTYADMLDRLKKFNASNTNPTLESMKAFSDPFAKELDSFSKAKGFNDRQSPLLKTAIANPRKFEEDMKVLEGQQKAVKQEEAKEFSVKRFATRVTSTATMVIGSLVYIVFCLTIGMLAANQAIGREPGYRVLYFLYGAIFAPILVFYYLYLWFNDKSPKIYTLLPLTQTIATTTIGRFLLFPFAYKEDKPARDLLVEFMTHSAEMVGKTFDAKSLGSIGQQIEAITENLKNLTTNATNATNTTEAATAITATTAAKVIESLPSLDKLRVNALKPNTTI
jgi:hypothetical protein